MIIKGHIWKLPQYYTNLLKIKASVLHRNQTLITAIPLLRKLPTRKNLHLVQTDYKLTVCSQPIIVDSSPCHELLSWALFFVMKVATHIFLQETKIAWSWLPATLKIQLGLGNDLMAPFRSVNPISDGLSNNEFT